MDRAAALQLLGLYAPADQADMLLSLHGTVSMPVGGLPVTYYDPYAAAYAYLVAQQGVKAWQLEGVREEYVDSGRLLDWLAEQSRLLRLEWPLPDAAQPAAADLTLDIRGWGG